MSIVKRLKEDARIVKYTHKYTANLMTEAADTITAYAKALEDIRAEIWDSGMNMTGEYQGVWIRYRDIEKILDKHNPDTVGKEQNG